MVVARNEVAFRGRYGQQALLAGTYAVSGTNLSNGGELITVLDSAVTQFNRLPTTMWPLGR